MPEPGQTLKPMVRLGKKPEQCWEWLGPKTAGGYGKKTFNSRDMLAHRWMWEQLFGPIPHGLVVHHRCENPSCVNPAHLVVCTQAQNCREASTTTLTSEDVLEIKRAKADAGPGVRGHLAEKFGCSPQLISDIWAGRAWARARKFTGPNNPRNQYSDAA